MKTKIVVFERLFPTVIRFGVTNSFGEAETIFLSWEIRAVLIKKRPQSCGFRFFSENPLDTVKLKNKGLSLAFLHCNLFLCNKLNQGGQGF